ncbi:GNAT family N-acetyltransferase [Tomitella fengzijianii]|uniref:GNAT family N-acetyltransferase n=1 Tax=Tomitella fengzijianii TaxID=2597660 RepID=A0A516X816_9ACTN|nr:GNAT family N-acetyltransferase [Tomitella fengzijianii]QDQ98781.1 GNAT family N-acetyltransferase [Tomitella fengzijianii]
MRCDVSVLDDPVRNSLLGAHAHLARRVGGAVTYREGVCTFAAVPPLPAPADWRDLEQLVGAGGLADLFSAELTAPAAWTPEFAADGVQMVLDPPQARPVRAAVGSVVELGADDVPDMLALTAATTPGPFFDGTISMGTYLGVRDDGRLVAMAGERLRPPGWTEISAVCTAPQVRGRGLASLLVDALAQRILARDERPFLHAVGSNTGAIALYERLGFRHRKDVRFHGYRVPAGR